MSRKSLLVISLAVVLLLTPTLVYAEIGIAPSVEAASGRFARGAANIIAGWTELPHEIDRIGVEKGLLRGLAEGLVLGAGRTVLRTLNGAYEVATFYLDQEPYLEDVHTWEWGKVTSW